MLSVDDIIQSNTGSITAGTSVVVSLPSGTTVDNTLVVFITTGLGSSVSAVPANFVTDVTGNVYHRPLVPAAETSWTFTLGASGDATWAVFEMSGIDPVEPFEIGATATNAALANGGTLSSNTASGVGLTTVSFGFHAAYITSGTATKSWGSFTNGFTQLTQLDSPTGTYRPCLAITAKFGDGAAPVSASTATLTISSGTAVTRARMLVFRAAGSPVSAPLHSVTGFEFGTHGGLAEATVHATGSNQPLGTGVGPPVGTWGTHYQIGSSFARNGGYGLNISTSAATCYVPVGYSVTGRGVWGQSFRVTSGSGTPTLMTWDITTGTDLLLVYEVSSERLGLRWGAGAVEWQTGTTPVGTWAWVEVRLHVTATTHQADWWCETGDGLQISPADLTGQVSTTLTKVVLSGLGSQTVTFDVDDPVTTIYFAAFPMGVHKVVRLTVDQAATPTISGTSGNFNMFTANGTLAAWVAATAKTYLDECPPTVSASADGVAQVTLAASDYMEFPMETYTLAAGEVIAGVRMIASMWGGTGTGTGTLGIRGWDGVTESVLAPNSTIYDAGSPTAVSATEPLWMAFPWGMTPGNPWTQARLNAAALRVGFSTDATPDMGVSALYLEVAIKTGLPSVVAHRLTSDEDPEAVAATVTQTLHPYTSGVRTYTVTNGDVNRTAVFNYSIGGTPQTAIVVAPFDPPEDVTVGAEAFGEVDSTSFGWQ